MIRRLLSVTALSLFALSLTACSGGGGTSYGAISGDLTPELRGTAERPIDIDRHYAVMRNNNYRMAADDWIRMWYLDHPSRLSPFPITYTSGQPR